MALAKMDQLVLALETVKRLEEANSELREQIKLLQQTKSCVGCKSFNGTQICNNFIARSGYESHTFCCNRYEPNETYYTEHEKCEVSR